MAWIEEPGDKCPGCLDDYVVTIHTFGPWEVQEHADRCYIFRADDDSTVAVTSYPNLSSAKSAVERAVEMGLVIP